MPDDLKYERAVLCFRTEDDEEPTPLDPLQTITPERANEINGDESWKNENNGTPAFLCPGHDYEGCPCMAELFVRPSSLGRLFFFVSDINNHSDGCMYLDYNSIRIQPNPNHRKKWSLESTGIYRTLTLMERRAKEREEDKSDKELGMDDIDRVWGRKEGYEPPIEHPSTTKQYAEAMLRAGPEEATEDGKMIEDQILCERTSKVFYRHIERYTPGDYFVLLLKKGTPSAIDRANEKGEDNVIYLSDRYYGAPKIIDEEEVYPENEDPDDAPIFKIITLDINMRISILSTLGRLPKNGSVIVRGKYAGITNIKIGEERRKVYIFKVYNARNVVELPKSLTFSYDRDF